VLPLQIARQEYYFSKQEYLIQQLRAQESRYSLLSQSLLNELAHHQATHHLMATAVQELKDLGMIASLKHALDEFS